MISPEDLEKEILARMEEPLSRQIPRRSLLVRAAVAGCALAVAPIKYLTRPAYAACAQPADCSGQKCANGYTMFCCSLNSQNSCPTGTHIGGFWKCCSYTGSRLCSNNNCGCANNNNCNGSSNPCSGCVRFYIDCNADQDGACNCSGGSTCCCHCYLEDCTNYASCCNHFVYGQCNTSYGTTYIKCRIVRCDNPGNIWPNQCTSTLAFDAATCAHDQPCL